MGSTAAVGRSVMVNVVGESPDSAEVLALSNAHLHLYDKEERAGRKLGHITLRAEDEQALQDSLDQLAGMKGIDLS